MKTEIIRHSLAHVLAASVQNMFPEARFGIGPAIENGFYYDFELPRALIPADLPRIEKRMKETIRQSLSFKKEDISKEQAEKLFENQPYKLELIRELPENEISVYKMELPQGKTIFTDLCKGPHVNSTKEILVDAFKLTKIAGAYWKGDEKRPMLQRIYGLAFETKKELEDYILQQEEAEKRDHRVLGQKLELFMLSEEIGAGLPIWLPNGALIRKIIEDYLYTELTANDYKWLYTPHIGSRKLWETSGHWSFYNESMYPPLEVSQSLEDVQKGKKAEISEQYLLKPMNCPFHVSVYNWKTRSYRDLPVKFAEFGTVYRYERSGTLHGLTRVRGFTQDDAHLICTPEQMPQELTKLVKHGMKMLKDFGFKDFQIYLATQPEKFVGEQSDWDKATNELENVLKKLGLKYQIDKGGGVFYGPKIDIKIQDSLKREWQCTTIQFDFNLPDRFNMVYTNQKGEKEKPFMIHRALLGSMERFFGVLIEHYAGAFPLWLSPEQIWVIPISEKHVKYAKEMGKKLKEAGFRAEVRDENDTISKKIREGEIQKIPYLLVVGDKEMKRKSLAVRMRGKGDLGEMKLKKFIEKIKEELEKKK